MVFIKLKKLQLYLWYKIDERWNIRQAFINFVFVASKTLDYIFATVCFIEILKLDIGNILLNSFIW